MRNDQFIHTSLILSLAGAATSIITCLSRQNRSFVCRDKYRCFVATKVCLSRHKHVFIATNICRDKSFVATKTFCRDKRFVAASTLLSRQKTCFVATKIILVAAPANDIIHDLGFTDTSPDFSCVHPLCTKSRLDLLRYAQTDTSLVRALWPIVALSRYSPYSVITAR